MTFWGFPVLSSSRAAILLLLSPFLPPSIETSADSLLDVDAEIFELFHAKLCISWPDDPRRVRLARRILGVGDDVRSGCSGVRSDNEQLLIFGQSLLRGVVNDRRDSLVQTCNSKSYQPQTSMRKSW
jgi:hypothetical protein